MSDKAIEIESLSYRYKSQWLGKGSPGLKAISLSVDRGESFGFLGHNGAGKTTTIKCLLGLVHPDSGQIRLNGIDHRKREARREVGYLPEHPYYYDHLTVREILQMFAALSGLPRSEIPEAIDRVLKIVGMQSRQNNRMRTLSKGLTQRVALAQAIIGKPSLLILDEPFSGLDPLGRREFKDIFSDLRNAGTTIFMSSHILSDVEFLCSRASIMVDGELKGVFDLKELPQLTGGGYELVVRNFERARAELSEGAAEVEDVGRFLKLFFSDRGPAERALQLAIQHSVEIESFNYQYDTLEDVFVELVGRSEGRVG